MEARDLDEAIDLVNATGYGLTSGLESLDDREQQLWQEHIRAGNLYINRPTTGAIVLRQPFGGMGKSAVGPGIKAGGPNYVVPLMTFRDLTANFGRLTPRRPLGGLAPQTSTVPSSWPNSTVRSASTSRSPRHRPSPPRSSSASSPPSTATSTGRPRSSTPHTITSACLGEDNFRRYRPVGHLRIRIHPDDTVFDVFARAAAARAAGCRTTVSSPPESRRPRKGRGETAR